MMEDIMVVRWYNQFTSSFIKLIGYKKDKEELYVVMESGVYKYFNVPINTLDAFLNSESKGRYFDSRIKNVYVYLNL